MWRRKRSERRNWRRKRTRIRMKMRMEMRMLRRRKTMTTTRKKMCRQHDQMKEDLTRTATTNY